MSQLRFLIGGESVFVTPTRPGTSRSMLGYGTPSSSLNSPYALFQLSPSVADSQISTGSGSVFHDEETAKIELNNFLKQLGVKGPDKHAKARPHRLSKIMSEAMSAFKKLFVDYAGKPMPEEACKCQFCKIITAAVKAKVAETKSKKEKYLLLTSLPLNVSINEMHHGFGVTWYMARTASKLRSSEGPFSYPDWKSTGKPISVEVKEKVKVFYLSEENSRSDPTARTSINVVNELGKTDRVERRVMLANLKESFIEFKK